MTAPRTARMKNLTKDQHYEVMKTAFRNRAKQAGADFLISLIWDTRRKIRDSKFQLTQIQNEQRRLKKDYKALHSLLEEYKK